MKVAIASDDQIRIAQHFGRTKGFVITEIEDDSVKSRDYRLNTFTQHGKGATHNQHAPKQQHSHAGILRGLKDCAVVISRGMGKRMYEDLKAAGIDAVITSEEEVEKATAEYLRGALKDHPEKGCSH